jgi:hypothetical protein
MANERHPNAWIGDMRSVVDTKLMQDIVSDFRNYSPTPRADPSAKVQVHGAGTVKTADVGPQHRPIDASATNSGWVEPPKVDQWKAPGIDYIDQMVSAQDERDRLERIKQAAETAALKKAEAQFLATKAQAEPQPKNKEKGPKLTP